MKIYFDTDVENRKYEGRSQTTLYLINELQKKGFEIVGHPKDADIIHFHSSGIFRQWKAAKLRKKYNKPVIYTLYSVSKTEPLNHFRNHFAQRRYLRPRKTSFILSYSAVLPLKLRGYKLKELDTVITPSRFVKKRLFSNSKVIRIGIDLEKYRPLETADSRSLKIGYFGHPSAYKGVLDFARASKFFPGESYIHISDITDKMYNNLKRINAKLRIIGHIKKMGEAYNNMDIIVLPYRSHLAGVANPLVLVEAMACGKAIITTNFSYLKEITKGSAIHVPPYNRRKMIMAVKYLANNPEVRKKIGRKARIAAEKEFNQKKMVEAYIDLYESIL